MRPPGNPKLSSPNRKKVRLYRLPDGYQQRLIPDFWDDRNFQDQWQREVYLLAADVAEQRQLKTVLDIGCGSGFKLITYLGHLHTTGIDLPPTVQWLYEKYPDRRWEVAEYETPIHADLIICADVLEHLPNPDLMMRFIQECQPRYIVFSTPDRESRNEPPLGPPSHKPHCHEWSQLEFVAYVNDWFPVILYASMSAPHTQCVLCAVPNGQ